MNYDVDEEYAPVGWVPVSGVLARAGTAGVGNRRALRRPMH